MENESYLSIILKSIGITIIFFGCVVAIYVIGISLASNLFKGFGLTAIIVSFVLTSLKIKSL